MRLSVTAVGRLLLPMLLLSFNCLAAENGDFKFGDHDGTKEALFLAKAMGKKTNVYLENSRDDLKAITPLVNFPCPIASTIEPCVCSVDPDGNRLSLDCTSVESEKQLAAVFQQDFPVKEFYEFSMSSNYAVKMIHSIMNGVTFERVILAPGPFELEAISDYFLLDLKDTVKEILIQGSKLSTDSFPFLLLPSMNQLSTLTIIDSDINWIPPIRAPKLSFFGVSSSPVELLKNGTIPVGSRRMTVILDNNNISSIEPGSIFFADEESAASNEHLGIQLVNNRLSSLQAGTFHLGNRNVTLLVYRNQITSIEPGAYVLSNAQGNGELYIDFGENQLQYLQAGTFPVRNGLVSLYLHSNNISSIEPGTFVLPEAKGDANYGRLFINLIHNQLHTLQAGTFPLRNGEVTLLLHYNSISSIEPGTFELPELTDSMILQLHLWRNALTTIEEEVFGDLMPFVSYLGLQGNPLECGCDVTWLILNTEFMAVVDGRTSCADGTHLHDLNPQDYVDLCLV